jgi:hypothetical protein
MDKKIQRSQLKENDMVITINSKNRNEALNLLDEKGIKYDSFNNANVSLEAEYPSVLNFKEPVFLADEVELYRMYEVFKYYHKVEKFEVLTCSKATGISEHYVKKIYDKHLKNK